MNITIMNPCKICTNTKSNKTHTFHETMFGYDENFEYIECASCGCLQIKDIPGDLTKYYPKNYYSFQPPKSSKDSFLSSIVKHSRAEYVMSGKSILGMLIVKLFGSPPRFDWFKKAKIQLDSEILDVGCGAGEIPIKLAKEGFSKVTGIDPYIEGDISFEIGVNILKKSICDVEQQYDFIMLNHSFEHMPEPLTTLKELHQILRGKKYLLIRIPVATSFAYRKYGSNWRGIDPPRHFFLHTPKSIEILANQAGFELANILFDSGELQFAASEQLMKGIPIANQKSTKEAYSKKEIQNFKKEADKLNRENDGDQACFFLYKP